MKNLLVGLALLVAAATAVMLKPAPLVAAQGPKIDLETLIPKQFEGWHLDESLVPLQASPDQEAALKEIYSQILTRTYISSSGQRIMLSVVYGDGIDRQLDVHRPEYCYAAQGFQVSQYIDQVIQTLYGSLSVRRLVASNGARIEPISYWIRIGDKSLSSTFERKLEKIKRGLTGRADSGMLVRVSSIDKDEALAYKEQEAFINALLQAMPDAQRKQLIGGKEPELAMAKDLK
ncbi:MAG TPA: EpsI family protein [Gallionellaceae bacterium]|nr:EpsI family protein [Gallionellaceae bacterium]